MSDDPFPPFVRDSMIAESTRRADAKRILVVDDHPSIREEVRMMLAESHPNWEICGEAGDGQEALEAIRRLTPDLIVLDVTLPGTNGMEPRLEWWED